MNDDSYDDNIGNRIPGNPNQHKTAIESYKLSSDEEKRFWSRMKVLEDTLRINRGACNSQLMNCTMITRNDGKVIRQYRVRETFNDPPVVLNVSLLTGKIVSLILYGPEGNSSIRLKPGESITTDMLVNIGYPVELFRQNTNLFPINWSPIILVTNLSKKFEMSELMVLVLLIFLGICIMVLLVSVVLFVYW